MPNSVQIRGGQSYSRSFNFGLVRASYSIGVNPAGAGGIGPSVSVGVGVWEGRGGVDSNGNYQIIGGVGYEAPPKLTRNFGQLRAFTGIGYSSRYGGVDVTDIELRFKNIGPGGLNTGVRYQNQTPLSEILGRLNRRRDPMVIDLGNDGLTLTPLRFSTAAFDFGGDGAREQVGWVGSNEGIIVSDVDGDGKIASLADLFGDGEGDAFLRLAEYDSNNDGAITSDDAIFTSLRIWRDINVDGIAQADELVAPDALNIKSIGLAHTAVARDVDGNQIINAGNVALQNGVSLNSYSLAFATDGGVNAGVAPDIDIPDQLLALPNLHGFGNVRELWDWALVDPDNMAALKDAVADFGNAKTLSSLVGSWSFTFGGNSDPVPVYNMSKFEKFLAKWTGVSGGSDDEKIKGIAEKFAGHPLPLAFAGNIGFYDVFMEFSANIALRFLEQTAIAPLQAAGVSLARSLAGLDQDTLTNMTQEQFDQIVAASVPAGVGSAQSSLVGGLVNIPYNFSTDTFPDGLAEAVASRIGLNESDTPSEGWEKLRELQSKDPWLISLAEKANPDPTKGTAGELALRIASNNTILPVHGMDHEVLTGTSADDILQAASGSVPLLIRSGGGSDIILGGSENTTILFEVVNGHTIVSDTGGSDEIAFTSLLSTDVSYAWSANTNTFSIVTAQGSIDIENAFSADGTPRIERVSFGDGTVFSGVELRSAALTALTTAGDDVIVGWQRSQVISGGFGNDRITGGGERDFLSGGEGADTLFGEGGDDVVSGDGGNDTIVESSGNDTYLWSPGEGDDLLTGGGGWDGYNILELPDGVVPEDLLFSYGGTGGHGIQISVAGLAGSFTIDLALSDSQAQIDEILFGDGRRLSREQLSALAMPQLAQAADGQIWGSQFGDVLSTGSGDDHVLARNGDDIISGGTGSDFLSGGGGNDIYRFAKGDGNDTIVDTTDRWDGGEGGNDRIELGAGIAPADITISQQANGNDLLLTIAGGDSIYIAGEVTNGANFIEQLVFADGTVWDRTEMFNRSIIATEGADRFYGTQDSETVAGAGGDDWVSARNGDDIVIGGTGNDFLSGGGGNDVYRFAKGDGRDTIVDGVDRWDGGEGGNDRIELGAGITAADITVSQQNNGSDLLLTIAGGDSIYISGEVTNGANFIEELAFTDGTVWSRTELFSRSVIATEGADRFYGTHDGETIAGAGGDDWISARNGDDIVIGGAGNDFLSGGGGNDVYRFAKGDGNDTIVDGVDRWDGGEGGDDRIELGAGIATSDVSVTRQANGTDFLLTIAGGDSIYIGGAPITNGANTIEQVTFADGTIWTVADLLERSRGETSGNDTIYGTNEGETIAPGAGDDWVSARNGDDIVVGGTGNDFLSGGGGNDVYRFAKGDGQDTIVDGVDRWDGGEGGNDRIELGAGITAADITVSQQNNGNDLLLTIAGGDSIYLTGQITNGANQIEEIAFADGTVWTAAKLLDLASNSTSGDDRIYGTQGNELISAAAGNDWVSARNGDDIVVGGTGNDFLSGGGGNDTYRFAKGDGNDTIVDGVDRWDGGEGGNDRIEFAEGIATSDVTVARQANGNDFLLTIAGGDSIYIGGSPINNGANTIEEVAFADGTIWTIADLLERSRGETAGNDTLYGTNGGETIAPGAGDDWVSARNGDDIVIGGAGADFLSGGGGNDVYRFAKGDGNDTIVDGVDRWDGGEGGNDRIELGTGIETGDVTVSQQANGTDLLLTIAGGDSIYIGGAPITNGANTIEEVAFADGTVWSAADLFARSTIATAGNDRFYGTHGSETLTGAAGDDWISARNGDDVVVGGTGNDFLSGGGGNDTYRFAKGDGNDTIVDGVDRWDGGEGGNDRIELGANISPDDVVVTQQANGTDFLLTIAGGDSIYIGGAPITNGANTIEEVAFADGTVWSATDLFTRSMTATVGNDRFYGTHGAETLTGGAGDDWISARNGDDIVVGGTGADFLSGGGGNDVYRFARGDGNDTIVDGVDRWDGGEGGSDRIELGAGIAPADITVSQQANGTDLLLTIAGGDSIYIGGAPITNGANTIEEVAFADGTVWTAADLFNRSVAATSGANRFYGSHGNETIASGAGDDWISARNGDDVIVGGTGNDFLSGGGGNDVYRFARGDGNDTIVDGVDRWDGGEGGNDRIELGQGINPEDVTIGRAGDGGDLLLTITGGDSIYIGGNPINNGANTIEELAFADGTVWDSAELLRRARLNPTISGSSGDDSLSLTADYQVVDAGTGNDYISVGGNGGGTILFRSGGGHDTLDNPGSGYHRTDELKLEGLNPADVSFRRDGDQLAVTVLATGDTFNVRWQFWQNSPDYGLATIRFADGTTWDRSRIQQEAWIRGDAGDNSIGGSGLDETLIGNAGNDYLEGGSGSDVYRYASGDGSDRINEAGSASDIDVLQLTDLNAADVSLRRDGVHLYVKDIATGQETRIDNQFYSDATYGIEQIAFADGAIWDRAAILARLTNSTDGNDTVSGSLGDDYLRGLGGNDQIDGLGGADELRGDDGDDDLTGGAGNDVLIGGNGTDIARFAGARDQYRLSTVNGVLTVTDTSPELDGNDGTDQLVSIETLSFSDATVSLAAPIVLDLDGNGVTLVSQVGSHARFDLDGDGRRDQTSWIDGGDALLAIDRNGNGAIGGVGEISFIGDKSGATSDLDGLIAFDTNGDGLLSAGDEAFSKFGVWQDANGDGVVDAGEFSSLTDAGIASIDLVGKSASGSWNWGCGSILNTGSFTRNDGSLGAFADVALSYRPTGNTEASASQAAAARLVEAAAAFRPFDAGLISNVRNGMAIMPAAELFGIRDEHVQEKQGGMI